ncbi:hypothetical protein [Belliella pelovolcani]|uniref:hypothetical protein n=1 Tax=Belliella pelovolcani TaxID=529505 RepID=UPI00391AC4DC
MTKQVKKGILIALSNGSISKVEAKYLIDLKGVFTPNSSRQDKPYKLVCSVFENTPELLSLFKVDLSELTDNELRYLAEKQNSIDHEGNSNIF